MESLYRWMLNGGIALFCAIMICSGAETRTLFVSPTGDGTTGDSWKTAYQTLNGAYTVSGEGDHIHVENGVYKETLLINKNSIRLVGGLAGNSDPLRSDSRIHEFDKSVLDANGAFSIVLNYFKNGSADGFVLKNSTARGSSISNSSVSLCNCDVLDHINGGGIYISSGTVEFRNCTIANNQCDREAGGISAYFGSNVLIDSCTIENNEGVYRGGIDGGKILIISNSVIRGNRTLADC